MLSETLSPQYRPGWPAMQFMHPLSKFCPTYTPPCMREMWGNSRGFDILERRFPLLWGRIFGLILDSDKGKSKSSLIAIL